MRRTSTLIGLAALVAPLVLWSAPAKSADSELASATELRTGPGSEFPPIKRLAKGLKIDIHGCLQTWDWCDVTWRGARGWVPAATLVDIREDHRISVSRYGQDLGVPVVSFSLGKYWDSYYNQSPWYGDRDVWSQRSASARFEP